MRDGLHAVEVDLTEIHFKHQHLAGTSIPTQRHPTEKDLRLFHPQISDLAGSAVVLPRLGWCECL